MNSSEVTARDRVWAAIVEQTGRFQVSDVRDAINERDQPTDETIRRVLRSATELGTVIHQSGSPYYWFAGDAMAGYPYLSTDEIIDQATSGRLNLSTLLSILEKRDRWRISDPDVREERKQGRRNRKEAFLRRLLDHREGRDPPDFLDPDGIETEAFIEQFPAERTEEVIYTESDEEIDIADIISDERAASLAQSRHQEGQSLSAMPSSGGNKLWQAAFCEQFAGTDHIVIVDTATGEPVDLSEHLDMDFFAPGTKILSLGILRETPRFEEIVNELGRSYRSTLDYRAMSGDTDRDFLEAHVRSRLRPIDPASPEWAVHVERLVTEVAAVVDPTDPQEQSRIAEWVRSIAQEEVED